MARQKGKGNRETIIKCEMCGKTEKRLMSNTKFCHACRKKVRNEYMREYMSNVYKDPVKYREHVERVKEYQRRNK